MIPLQAQQKRNRGSAMSDHKHFETAAKVISPRIASAVASWSIARYSITEEKAHEVRKELEARRGTV
jgi:hypothetical protein